MANPARQQTAQRAETIPALERAPTIGQVTESRPASSAGALTAMLLVTLGMVVLTFAIVAITQ